MAYLSICILLLPVFLVLYKIWAQCHARSRKPASCRDPPRHSQIDRFFGLDHFWKLMKLQKQRVYLQTCSEWHEIYGNTFTTVTLGTNIFHTCHPDNLKAVFEGKGPWSVNRLKAMEPFCGRGFVTTDGEEWKAHRALLAPTLSESSFIDFDALKVAFDRYLKDLPINGEAVDLAHIFEEFYWDLSSQFLFGKNLSLLRFAGSPVSISALQEALEVAQFWMGMRIVFRTVGRLLSGKKFKEACEVVHTFVDHHIGEAWSEISHPLDMLGESIQKPKSKIESSLVYSLAIQNRTPLEVRHLIIQAMLVTQDTTGIVLSNTIFSMSRAPELWARLRKEIAGLGPWESWNAQTLRGCTYLQNLLKESLRLHSLFSANSRVALTDTVLPRGGGSDGSAPVFVPTGSKVSGSLWTLHHQSSVFGDDADAFNPNRWDCIRPDTWEFIPFGHGPRSCPGRHKALTEAAYIIGRMALKFRRIDSRDDQPWTEDDKLVLKNLHGCKVALYAD
ncbi:cytochrome P450 [Calycina marina]|uniref:Cytochrome P450 n=1 Tax=Calycina marina TaxID=1763456 RepID=A0A9P7YX87_9HELO|nr:cytochrome P450 [Calycina marina]